MRCSFHQQHMSSTRRWIRIGLHLTKTTEVVVSDRFNRPQTRIEIGVLALLELINRRELHRTSKLEACLEELMNHLNTVDLRLVTLILPTRNIKLAWAAQIRILMPLVLPIARVRHLLSSNSKKRYSSQVMISWLNTLTAWWTSLRSWERTTTYKSSGKRPSRSSLLTMFGILKTEERSMDQWSV